MPAKPTIAQLREIAAVYGMHMTDESPRPRRESSERLVSKMLD